MMAEIESKFVYGGVSDAGDSREANEDFLTFAVLREDILLAVIADGAGSRQCGFALQPAVIAATELVDTVRRLYNANPDMIVQYPTEILIEAVLAANRTLGIFKVANEEMFSGFGTCLSCCLIIDSNCYVAHCGNTRVHIIRHQQDGSAKIIQITKDHTVAQQMVDEGKLSAVEYYGHAARYQYTSGLGFVPDPVIQSYQIKLRNSDVLVMTTDGIHYAIRPEFISSIILESNGWEPAASALIMGAKQEQMNDNMTAAVIYNLRK